MIETTDTTFRTPLGRLVPTLPGHTPFLQPETSRDSKRKWRGVCTCGRQDRFSYLSVWPGLNWIDQHMEQLS